MTQATKSAKAKGTFSHMIEECITKVNAPATEAPQSTEKRETIGSFTKTLILAGKSVKDVEKAIKAKYPNCGPQVNSIYFYRSKLHKSGELKKS